MFIHNQFRSTPKYPPKGTDLSGKTAIITGANTGLGFESAHQLLALKLTHLIIAVRSMSKGEVAATDLRKRHPHATIEVWPLDMASYDSVQAFARRAQQDLQRIDMVILNAGVSNGSFRIAAATGHEETIQVNYLSTVLLATLLLPIVKATRAPGAPPGVITLVNTGLALVAGFKNRTADPLLPSFDDQKNFGVTDTYSTTKTLAHLWLWRAAEFVAPDDVVLSLVDPGYIKGTGLVRDAPALARPVVKVFESLTGKTVQLGASCYVDAVATKGRESHGCFLMNWEISP